MDENSFLNTITSLYKENNWKEILQLGQTCEIDNIKKILWVWPSEDNLNFIGKIVKEFQLNGIISIGCGSGLFEWLLEQCTQLQVIGYEVNEEWWTSKYSCPQFIRLQFPTLPPETGCLNDNYALLFCYFNNGSAFLQYINVYKGSVIFIIGPGTGRGTHTNPEPFTPDLDLNWKLYKSQEIRNTKDFVAVYVRT